MSDRDRGHEDPTTNSRLAEMREIAQQASARFSAYRRGWQDGTSIHPVCELIKHQEDYNYGYADGRQSLRATMAQKRKDYGLKPEGTVHIA
jgi:hypothetical protein